MEHGNIAARAGRWSAEHWKTVTLAWLAFCVAALFAGGALGTKKIKDADSASGETAVAEHILTNANFKRSATESVLVQSKTATVNDPAFRAAVNDVLQVVSGSPAVKTIRSPLDPKNSGQVSRGGHAALVEFDIKGDVAKAQDKVQPFLDGIAKVQTAHPGYTIGEFGFAWYYEGVPPAQFDVTFADCTIEFATAAQSEATRFPREPGYPELGEGCVFGKQPS